MKLVDIYKLLFLPFFAVLTTALVKVIICWGLWLFFGDNSLVPVYFSSEFNSAIDAIIYAIESTNIFVLFALFLAGLFYCYLVYLYGELILRMFKG